MAGIERISIKSNNRGRGAWRFDVANSSMAYVHRVYRYLFPLQFGSEFIECTAEEKMARWDIDFGVDVILNLINEQTITIQEKILTTDYETVTVEYYQNPQTSEPGDWFNLKADYYFVGYQNQLKQSELRRWILLDWNQVRTNGRAINWQVRTNKNDGARANFRWAHFDNFPQHTLVAKLHNGVFTSNIDASRNELQYKLF